MVRRWGRVCLKMRKPRVVGTQKGGRKGETGNVADSGIFSSTGGQPGQLYFMAKDKLKVSHSAFTLLCALLSFQCAAVFLGVIGVIFSRGEVFTFCWGS